MQSYPLRRYRVSDDLPLEVPLRILSVYFDSKKAYTRCDEVYHIAYMKM